ncbi:aminotransferase [Actinoplanes sp. NPDC051494]|uniref:aminotransferase n=1 Tax=Actinoplanes sp. NPDC051494 TaxID=3363907 RepID=UPI003790D57F
MRLNPGPVQQSDSPIGTAYALLDRRAGRRPLLNLAQAAPQYPPAPAVVEHVAAVARDPHGADYGEISGLPHLREAVATDLNQAYDARITAANVLVTAGCNQAFCLAVSALAQAGDEVILALPYYFNHDMWLRMTGITATYLEPGPGFVPSACDAEALITARTRAIVLVTPGNPSGVTLSPATLAAFAEVAERHDIALVLDETYRTFRGTGEPAHRLFDGPRWERTVVSLHSFSKDLAIPGYRVGAVVASAGLNRQIAKLADCVAICAPRIGQEAAWAGLTRAGRWRDERAAEVAARRQRFETVMARRPGGFELLSSGGFFGWVRHPFPGRPTGDVARELVETYDTLIIPGTAFLPDDRAMLRVSFANVTPGELDDVADRLGLAGVTP